MFKTIAVGFDGREGGQPGRAFARRRLVLLNGGEAVVVRVLSPDYAT
jgi:hypothetical protein